MKEKYYLQSDIAEITKNLEKHLKYFSGKKFLISGANGFLGKYFIKILITLNKKLKKKASIVAIDIKFDKCEIYSGRYVKKIKQDINNIDKLSSSEIYGNPDKKNIPTKETYNGNVSSIEDRSCYDEGKRVGETLCYFYKIKEKVNCAIFRPFNIFGPGMPRNDYRVFPRFFNSIKKKQPITIFKSGKQTRTFCYVTDAITAMFLVIIKGNNFVYNIGNDKPEIDMSELYKIIKNNIGQEIRFKNIEYPKNYPQVEPQRRCPNINKIKQELNFKNKVGIEESIKRFYKWSKKHY